MNADHEQNFVVPGSIVQVDPDSKTSQNWAGCLVIVTEVKSFGIQGVTRVPGTPPGDAYIRLAWDEIELTGAEAVWMPK